MRRLGVPAARALAGAAAAAMLLALPGSALAVTNAPIAQTGGMTVTMPITSTGLTVTVNLDTATGNITSTTVSDPSLTQTKSSQSFVKFANSGNTEKVIVRAMGSRLAISAKVTTLAELVGTGSWSADVFGTGSKTTASYTIGTDGNGNPTVTVGTPSGGPGTMTWQASTPKSGSEDGEAYASAGGTFTYQGFKKTLNVSVKVDTEDGGASLSITLVGRDVQVVTGSLADLAGARTWTASLCNSTPVSVGYHVDATGAVVFDSATGAPAMHVATGNGLVVRFTGTNVGVAIRLKDNGDGTYTLDVHGFSGVCGRRSDHPTKSGHDQRSGGRQGDGGTQQSWTGWPFGDQGGFGGGDH